MPSHPPTAHPQGMTRNRSHRHRTRRVLLLAAGATVAVAGCNPHVPAPPVTPRVTTVAEGPEHNGFEAEATPTAFTAPFPVRLTGTQEPDQDIDLFTTTAPGPGTLASSCSDAVNVGIGDGSQGSAVQGGCGVDYHTDGGAVSIWIIGYEPGEPYAVTITFVPD